MKGESIGAVDVVAVVVERVVNAFQSLSPVFRVAVVFWLLIPGRNALGELLSSFLDPVE